MTQSNQQIKRIYEAVLREAPPRRAAYLDRICGGDAAIREKVERLLAAREELGDFLAEPTRVKGSALPAGVEEIRAPVLPAAKANGTPPNLNRQGTVIGRYKLLQKIGEGGFGDVYMAVQAEPVKRKVALKIIKLGMDTDQVVARFEAERQALALMDHPNIARILDGGATANGRPYFVMELVRGVPITEYCDTAHLDTRERLDLFRKVCHAVQHAHTKGIIHRDIKPSNVLVTLHDGVPVPKVIDFGIAKAIDRTLTEKTLFTQFQQMIGTPEYMSPEQAEMSGLDIDTRADVYSLGVLLYELLTGSKPFDMQQLLKRGYEEILRTIREEEPPRPSTRVSTLGRREIGRLARGHRASAKQLGTLLRGDLDWIVMRAMEKDRRRRYETAAAMADDVQRHLDDQPVTATPPTPWYRARKYVRRHRVGVVAASLVAVALLSGLGAALWGWHEASDQRSVTEVALQSERESRTLERQQRERAVAGEAEANRERDEKEKALAVLEKTLVRSEGTRLSAMSQATLSRDPTLAVLLAIEGAMRHADVYANKALLEALEKSPRREVVLDTTVRVISAVFSQDESMVITGGVDGTLHAWHARTGQRLRSLETGYATVVSLHARGREIIAALLSSPDSQNQSSVVLAWNPTTGASRTLVRPEQKWMVSRTGAVSDTIAAIEPTTESVILLSVENGEVLQRHEGLGELRAWTWPLLSPDRERYLTYVSGVCRLHDAQTGEILTEWRTRGNYTKLPEFSPEGDRIVADEDQHGVRVRSASDGRVICTLQNADQSGGFVFTPDGLTVISTMSKTMTWDATSGQMIRDFDLLTSIRTGILTPDGRTFVGSDSDGRVQFRDIATGTKQFEMTGKAWIPAIASDGRFIAADIARTRIIDPQTAGESFLLRGRANPCAFAMHPDGRHMVDITGFSSEEGRVWDLQQRRPTRYLPAHNVFWGGTPLSQILDAAFTSDGSRFATGGPFGWAYIWNGLTGEILHRISVSDPGFNEAVTGIAFSPDGKLLAMAGTMSRVRVHDAATGEEVCRLGDAPERANPAFMSIKLGSGRLISFSPHGSRLMLRHERGAPRIYDVASRDKLFELSVPRERAVQAATYSPCGRWISVSHGPPSNLTEGKCIVFDAESGKKLRELEGSNGRGQQFPSGFGPKGDRLLTCVQGEGVLVFDVATGNRKATLRVPGEPPNRACFSPDGRWVLAVSHQQFHIYVWDAQTGRLLHHLTDGAANSLFHNAAFTNDSRSIVMVREHGVRDRRIRVLPIELTAAAIRLRPRDLTAEECVAHGISLPVARTPAQGWTRPNDAPRRHRRQKLVDDVAAKLGKLIGDRYVEDKLYFRQSAGWLGIDDDIVWALERVGDALLNRHGHYKEALSAYGYALRESQRSNGDRDPRTQRIRLKLTELLAQLGRGKEIEPHLDALDVWRPFSRDRVAMRQADYLLATGKPRKAIAALEQVSSAWRDSANQAMAEAHMDLGNYDDAESLLSGTFNHALGSSPGWNYLKRRVGARRGVRLYTQLNNEEKLAAWKALEQENEKYRPAPIRPHRAATK